jgi:integrase
MEDGHPLLPHQVSRAFVKHLEEHGLKLIRLHDLRHTSATLGLAAGESIKEISVRLGHSDISITSKVYVDVPDSLAKQSSNNLSKLLNERRRAHA